MLSVGGKKPFKETGLHTAAGSPASPVSQLKPVLIATANHKKGALDLLESS